MERKKKVQKRENKTKKRNKPLICSTKSLKIQQEYHSVYWKQNEFNSDLKTL